MPLVVGHGERSLIFLSCFVTYIYVCVCCVLYSWQNCGLWLMLGCFGRVPGENDAPRPDPDYYPNPEPDITPADPNRTLCTSVSYTFSETPLSHHSSRK